MSVWLVGSTGQSEARDRAGLVQYLLVLRTSFPASESAGMGQSLLQAGWSPPRTDVDSPPLLLPTHWLGRSWAASSQLG